MKIIKRPHITDNVWSFILSYSVSHVSNPRSHSDSIFLYQPRTVRTQPSFGLRFCFSTWECPNSTFIRTQFPFFELELSVQNIHQNCSSCSIMYILFYQIKHIRNLAFTKLAIIGYNPIKVIRSLSLYLLRKAL